LEKTLLGRSKKNSLFEKELLVLLVSFGIAVISVIMNGKTLMPVTTGLPPSAIIPALALTVSLVLVVKARKYGRKGLMKSWIIMGSSTDGLREATKLLVSFLKRRSLGTRNTFYLLHVIRNGEEHVQLCAPGNTGSLIEEFLSSLKPEIEYKPGKTADCPGEKDAARANIHGDVATREAVDVGEHNAELAGKDAVLIGCTYEGSPVYIAKKDFFRHVGVFGSTGSGKTTTCSIIASRLAGIGVRVVVLDWHGEYPELLPPMVTSVLRPVSMQMSINPFAIGDRESLVDILVDVFDLTLPQASLLSRVLRENEDLPTLQKLLEAAMDNEDNGGWNREIKLAIARRMEPLLSREGTVLFSIKNSFALPEKGSVLVIDLSDISSNRLRKLYSLMYLRLIYAEAIKKSPLETVVIIDEAHNILPKTEVNFIAKMLAEVRKMMLGLVISTQSPSSINSEYLKNLNTKIVHRVVNGADKRVLVESLGGPGKLSSLLSSLRVGDAIISLPDSPKPQLVKITSVCGGQG
jgi:hypothetical protein